MASPIFVTSETSSRLEFELLADDGGMLEEMIGEPHFFSMGPTWASWGVLRTLVPSAPSHPVLAALGDREILKGVIELFSEPPEPQ